MIAEQNSQSQNPQSPSPAAEAASRADSHLRYLLTAYVFGDISAAGRREVEQHLDRCDECRAELTELESTVTLVEEVLGDPNSGSECYSFEERRLERVLVSGWPRPRWRKVVTILGPALAAVVVIGVFIYPTMMGRRMKLAGWSENAAPASRVPNISQSAPLVVDGRADAPGAATGADGPPDFRARGLATNWGDETSKSPATNSEAHKRNMNRRPKILESKNADRQTRLKSDSITPQIPKGATVADLPAEAPPVTDQFDIWSHGKNGHLADLPAEASPVTESAINELQDHAVPPTARFRTQFDTTVGKAKAAPSQEPMPDPESTIAGGLREENKVVDYLRQNVTSSRSAAGGGGTRGKPGDEMAASESEESGAASAEKRERGENRDFFHKKYKKTREDAGGEALTYDDDSIDANLAYRNPAKPGGDRFEKDIKILDVERGQTETPRRAGRASEARRKEAELGGTAATRNAPDNSRRPGDDDRSDSLLRDVERSREGALASRPQSGPVGGDPQVKLRQLYERLQEQQNAASQRAANTKREAILGTRVITEDTRKRGAQDKAMDYFGRYAGEKRAAPQPETVAGVPLQGQADFYYEPSDGNENRAAERDAKQQAQGEAQQQLGEPSKPPAIDLLGAQNFANNVVIYVQPPAGQDSTLHITPNTGQVPPIAGYTFEPVDQGRFAGGQQSGESYGLFQGVTRDFPGPEIRVRSSDEANDASTPFDFGGEDDPEMITFFGNELETNLRAYGYYKALDPDLSLDAFSAQRLLVPAPAVGDEGLGRDGFRERYGVNPFVDTQRDHLSTFAMDVDTASYTRTRGLLRAGQLPDPKTVRTEEFVNNFPTATEADPSSAFSVFCDGGPSPFGKDVDLLQVTVKARELQPGERRRAMLTFAVDTSGSMNLESRLGLVKAALRGLLQSLDPEDRVAVVAYGARAYLALPHTPAREQARILGALDSLEPGGSTNVEAGLDLAYRVADESFGAKGLNRIILCTDGVATSGSRGAEQILEKVRVFARRGIYLSAVGFGRQRYDDAFMEQLSGEGNGNYAYVDSPTAARDTFQSNLPSVLQVLARDAKIQVDFDPEVVSHYRLLGYENRDIKDTDFRNDKVDAGEVGPGSTVTALYEVKRRPGAHGALGRIFIRFHHAATSQVEELDFPLAPGVLAPRLLDTNDRFRFVAAVAEFAELLRESYWARDGSYASIVELIATMSPSTQARPETRELVELVALAQALSVSRLVDPE